MDGGNPEPHGLELFNDPGPDRLDPQAGEAPVRVEQDKVGLARTGTKRSFLWENIKSGTFWLPFVCKN